MRHILNDHVAFVFTLPFPLTASNFAFVCVHARAHTHTNTHNYRLTHTHTHTHTHTVDQGVRFVLHLTDIQEKGLGPAPCEFDHSEGLLRIQAPAAEADLYVNRPVLTQVFLRNTIIGVCVVKQECIECIRRCLCVTQ